MAAAFGAFFKQMRGLRGLTLRRFCLENGLDPGNVSKLERGKTVPPAKEKLEHLAECLGLEEGSSDWIEFFDLAYAAKGEIPDDLMADEELVGNLPLVFRTLRGEKVPEDRLDALANKIRKT